MGNKTGITWVWKTREQKEADIQKYFHKSPIPELERRIKQTQGAIKTCEQRIERLRPLSIQEQIMDTKSSSQKVKEKIKEVQGKIANIKAKRRGREKRAENRIKECFERFEETLLTEQQMIAIIRTGTMSEDK